MLVVEAFLFKTFLTIFTFLIINAESAATDVSSWLYIPIFAFSLVKIIA